MELFYIVLFIVSMFVAVGCILRAVYATYGPFAKKSLIWLGVAVFSIVVGLVSLDNLNSIRDQTKESQKQELQAKGFVGVTVEFTENADVKLRSECPNRDLLLYKRGDLWYVGTEEIDSSKPVVSESEVALRPEVKWWCSKPPIKN